MVEKVKWIKNNESRKNFDAKLAKDFSIENIELVKRYHESFNVYAPTPLVRLKHLSKYLGVSEVLVKDESYRFGLNAFKVLGGSYAIGMYLAEKLGVKIDDLSFTELTSKQVRDKIGNITFTTATDGNHGRGVAWAAQQLGQKAVVYMPKGSSKTRLENIKATGAEATITNLNYDDAVRLSLKKAQENDWVIIQDTSWKGYSEIPQNIMKGYATIMYEVLEQMKNLEIQKPTHVFIQAGVGSLAGAVQGFLVALYGEDRPITVIVEPNKADCIYRSAENKVITNVTGDMDTIMAGLACGEPNPHGWEILKNYSDAFISCPEWVSADGMRVLGNPLEDDNKVISGESGAVTTGIVYTILKSQKYKELKDELQINEDSRILVINTEGDTDPNNYREIVWGGKYSNNR